MTTTQLPENLIVDFDVYDQTLAMPEDVFQERAAALRAIGPVVYSKAHGGHWIVTRYEEIHQVLRDPETFSSYPNNLVNAGQGKFIPIELDPPEHTFYRQALQPLFSPKRMKELEPQIRDVINELIDDFVSRGEAEFISEFAHELPTRVFLALMGWPLEDAEMFTKTTDVALQGIPGGTEEESAKAREDAANQIFGYFGAIVAGVRSGENTSDSLTAQIINTPIEMEDGVRLLTDEELYRMFFLLLIAGLHTVQGSLAWGIIHLANNPGQRQEIVDDPDTIPAAVEEILRIEAAVIAGRRATRDVEIGGVTIAEGEQLIVLLCSANRDGGEFEDPDELKIDRSPNRHLSFGAGPHRCIGSHLARIELKLAMEEIHKRLPDYRLVPEDPPILHATQVRGCIRLPITFTPSA
ncbi:cytochrome P450 [Rhodococcus sp. USK10]|uniref:Cytochrome P450 n=2 Tax=Rhodococcus TaxID=1827 RepID=A0A974W8V8_9NOCA|nr:MULTISPECIES: cytochrome P450 [Rhodococcus]MBV6762513.1 cytochrome P450 [Rhodococcus opacus]QSE93418.1 cytochrome P450 [Rhodococcus pseudokoreensis]QYB06121.1 cytochrome P450 [Rhodococcus sp. USK10]GCE44517.1 putative cytochrome P450 hydroxylase [Rhodococcus wratislaviensis]